MEPLTPGELVNLWVDEPVAPFQIALLAFFSAGPFRASDGGVDTVAIAAELARRAHALPALRRRITRAGGRPSWQEAPDDDPADHVTRDALPPGSDPLDWAAARLVRPLDTSRPLWRADVAALPDGRFAVLIVVHHALADGLRGVALAAALLEPQGAPPPPEHPGPAPTPSVVPNRVRRTRQLLADLRTAAPRTSLSRPIGPGRRLAVVALPLDELRATAHALGATVNDLLLTAVTAGLRRLLLARGDRVDGLRLQASVPVGARSPGQRNGILVVGLPVGEADDLRRLAAVVARTRVLKRRLASGGGHVMDVLRLPVPVARLAVRWMRRVAGRRVNLFVTNVPGPGTPLSLAGARLERAVPLAPLVRGVPLGIAALSYAGTLTVSVDADAAVDDVGVLAEGMAACIDELTAAATARVRERRAEEEPWPASAGAN
ncbi:wax ester/triacylglycerol synthase domain-containing protein [Geodermatophilus sp. SYSU D00691]